MGCAASVPRSRTASRLSSKGEDGDDRGKSVCAIAHRCARSVVRKGRAARAPRRGLSRRVPDPIWFRRGARSAARRRHAHRRAVQRRRHVRRDGADRARRRLRHRGRAIQRRCLVHRARRLPGAGRQPRDRGARNPERHHQDARRQAARAQRPRQRIPGGGRPLRDRRRSGHRSARRRAALAPRLLRLESIPSRAAFLRGLRRGRDGRAGFHRQSAGAAARRLGLRCRAPGD